MEDVSVRAITIGVGVLISIATITAVLTYYNTAKQAVRDIGSGTDIAGLYDKSIEDILLKKTVSGSDVKNIINYFKERDDVDINVVNLKLYESTGITNCTWDYVETKPNAIKKIVKEILPNVKYQLKSNLSGGINRITIEPE